MALLQKMATITIVAFFSGFAVKKVTAAISLPFFYGGGVVKKAMATCGFFFFFNIFDLVH